MTKKQVKDEEESVEEYDGRSTWYWKFIWKKKHNKKNIRKNIIFKGRIWERRWSIKEAYEEQLGKESKN